MRSRMQYISDKDNLSDATCASCSFVHHLRRDRKNTATWKDGAGKDKSWKRASRKDIMKLQSNFTMSEPSDRFLPISQLKAKMSLSGSSSASGCLCEPLPRTRMSTKVLHGKSKLRHKQARDTAREYGYTVYELSDLVPWFLCIYYTRNPKKNPTGMGRPLIGPHRFKNRRSNHMFLSVQQCPMFVPMKNYFEYWSLLGRLWDQEQDISAEKHRFQRISQKNDISTGPVRVDNGITPATLNGLEMSTRPELYRYLSRAGKRRVRARQVQHKIQTTQTSAISAPDHRCVIPKKLKEWRKKKFKQGEDVYNKCHTCRQVFSCGHWYTTLCLECDLSWNSRKTITCPLWAMRSEGKWNPYSFFSGSRVGYVQAPKNWMLTNGLTIIQCINDAWPCRESFG